jgi:hypothetical protein
MPPALEPAAGAFRGRFDVLKPGAAPIDSRGTRPRGWPAHRDDAGKDALMETEIRQARHNLRGRINALKLCVSAFEILESREELLEFLEMTDRAADRTVAALDALEAATDDSTTAHA